MDPKLLYWTAALVLLACVSVLAVLGVRHARRGEIARHRQAMRTAGWLIAVFLVSYVGKVIVLGVEDRSRWTLLDVWVLRIHETFVMVMLIAGAAAGWLSRSLAGSRLATRDPEDPLPDARTARRHRISGRVAVAGAVLAFVFATGILVGMYYRALA